MLEVYETKWRDLNLKAALKDSKIVNCSIQSGQITLQSVVKCHELMDMVLYYKYFVQPFNSHNDQDIISPYKIMQTSNKKKERYQLRDY